MLRNNNGGAASASETSLFVRIEVKRLCCVAFENIAESCQQSQQRECEIESSGEKVTLSHVQ